MPGSHATKQKNYTDRLLTLSQKRWKSYLNVQMPYRRNLQKIDPGKTLDIGCGVGRYLQYLPAGSVGMDHNEHSVKKSCLLGLTAYTPKLFEKSQHNKPGSFDSLLLSHVLEHLTFEEGLILIRQYTPLVKKGGKLIIFCPQEKGYASDSTHVTFLDNAKLEKLAKLAGYKIIRSGSFPLPRKAGKVFKYNEIVVVGQKQN